MGFKKNIHKGPYRKGSVKAKKLPNYRKKSGFVKTGRA